MPTVTIELTDAQAAAIRQRADRQGISLEEWLNRMVAACVPPDTVAHLQKTNPEEWRRRFRDFLASLDPNTPVLSDEAMSRESIYPDRS